MVLPVEARGDVGFGAVAAARESSAIMLGESVSGVGDEEVDVHSYILTRIETIRQKLQLHHGTSLILWYNGYSK